MLCENLIDDVEKIKSLIKEVGLFGLMVLRQMIISRIAGYGARIITSREGGG